VYIVYITYPQSYFQRVTYFVINEYEIQLRHYEKYLALVNRCAWTATESESSASVKKHKK